MEVQKKLSMFLTNRLIFHLNADLFKKINLFNIKT